MQDVSGIGNPFPKDRFSVGTVGVTHQKCDDVRRLSVCSGIYCKLVEMDTRTAEAGDSGAPYFSGGTAYGIHRGYDWHPFPWNPRDLFSRASYMDEAIGVSVATN